MILVWYSRCDSIWPYFLLWVLKMSEVSDKAVYLLSSLQKYLNNYLNQQICCPGNQDVLRHCLAMVTQPWIGYQGWRLNGCAFSVLIATHDIKSNSVWPWIPDHQVRKRTWLFKPIVNWFIEFYFLGEKSDAMRCLFTLLDLVMFFRDWINCCLGCALCRLSNVKYFCHCELIEFAFVSG